ncbi:MAG: hypothetical protein ACXWQO_01230, partial [Bdellovibrionota bacterium]
KLEAPEVAANERAEFEEFLGRAGKKGWETVVEFVDSHFAEKSPVPVSGEYQMAAKKCSEAYAKTANLGKGAIK